MATRVRDDRWQVFYDGDDYEYENIYVKTLTGALRLHDDMVEAKCETMARGIPVENISFRVNLRAFVVLHYDAAASIQRMVLRDNIPFSFDLNLPMKIMAVCDYSEET